MKTIRLTDEIVSVDFWSFKKNPLSCGVSHSYIHMYEYERMNENVSFGGIVFSELEL